MINNAGIVGDAPFGEMTVDRLTPVIDVHLKGASHVTRPAWMIMREQRYGRILNTCSAAAILGGTHAAMAPAISRPKTRSRRIATTP